MTTPDPLLCPDCGHHIHHPQPCAWTFGAGHYERPCECRLGTPNPPTPLEAAWDDTELAADGRKWRAAEAEGHVVTFTDDGYGLMHPPSCRPDLIGCAFNTYLADRGGPDGEPGRYRMTLISEAAEYVRLATPATEGGAR